MGGKFAKTGPIKKSWGGKDIEENSDKEEYKKPSKEEVQERVMKGSCFKCGKKWSWEYKCKTRQVFVIEGTNDEAVKRVDLEEDSSAEVKD